MNYSKYQIGVFDFVKHTNDNGIVQAVAGSGKTTTMEHAIRDHVSPLDQVLACAFNRHIAESLGQRMPKNVLSSTMNSFGYRAALQHFRGIRLDKDKVENALKFKVLKLDWSDKDAVKEFFKIKNFVVKVIDLLRNLNRSDTHDWQEAADFYGLTTPNHKNLDTIISETWTRVVEDKKYMDFTDQVFYPVYHSIPMRSFDQIWVDETQDLNPVQIAMVAAIGGRVIAIGDTHQAIYGFRGADPFAMRVMREQFNAVELPLSICYRCPKNVVLEAKKLVPHIEYADSAADGTVDRVKKDVFVSRVQDTDWVLCRTTAPLVQSCLNRIAEGRKATVKGRDIGDNIINLLEEFGYCKVDVLYDKLAEWTAKKLESLRAAHRDVEAQNVQDRVDTLKALMEGADDTNAVRQRIETIFSDNAIGITHATIHRSKGLETGTVWIIEPQLLPHPNAKLDWQKVQELNLHYVAITRAKEELFYVES